MLLDEKLYPGGLGKQIDSFDIIVRFNSCEVKGYEKYVGTRTTAIVMGTVWTLCGRYDDKGNVVRPMNPEHGARCTQRHVDEWWGRFAPYNQTVDDLNDVLLVTDASNFKRFVLPFMPPQVAVEDLTVPNKACFLKETDYEVWRGHHAPPGKKPAPLAYVGRQLRTGARFLMLLLIAGIEPTLVGFDPVANGTYLAHYAEVVVTANRTLTPYFTQMHNVLGELELFQQLVDEGRVKLLTPDPHFNE
eukprot:jgi/Mesvir1/8948/Mv22980-RA.1